MPLEPKGPTTLCGAAGPVLRSLTSSTACRLAATEQNGIKLLESIQRTSKKMVKGLQGKMCEEWLRPFGVGTAPVPEFKECLNTTLRHSNNPVWDIRSPVRSQGLNSRSLRTPSNWDILSVYLELLRLLLEKDIREIEGRQIHN